MRGAKVVPAGEGKKDFPVPKGDDEMLTLSFLDKKGTSDKDVLLSRKRDGKELLKMDRGRMTADLGGHYSCLCVLSTHSAPNLPLFRHTCLWGHHMGTHV